MRSYRRFIVDAFRRCKLKTAEKFTSLSTYSVSSCSNSRRSRVSEFFQSVSRNLVLQNVVKNNQRYKSPFLDRFFHNLNSRNLFIRKSLLGLLGCGAAYYWNLERVPYTERSHFVLLSTSLEKKLIEWIFERFIEKEGERLPPLHPLSIRVQRIGHEIVEAAQKGLRKEEESLIIKIFKKLGKRDYHQIPKFEWEFVVVDNPMYSAFYCPGGKIVVSTGWLDTFESDAEIAVMISHEVGHAIARHPVELLSRLPVWAILILFLYWTTNLHLVPAISKFLARTAYSQRHSAEKVSKLRCPLILKLFLYLKANLDLIPAMAKFLIWLPYSRRTELEADYIGLILMAAAGYDPHVALEVRKKFEQELGSWPLEDYYSSHPSHKTRAQLLSHPKVMEEALSLYNARV